MNLIASKPFFDVATGKRAAGEMFDEPRRKVIAHLIRSGLAREVVYETKVPALEVKADAEPFRIVPLPDPEPASVDSSGSGLLPVADVPAQRVAGSRGRRKRR